MGTHTENSAEGKAFENILRRQALSNGLRVVKNELSAKFVYGGRVRLLKSDLDFKIIQKPGRVAYVDAKSFQGARFPYTYLDAKQIERAKDYNDWGVPSGFVVWLREISKIMFYSGEQVVRIGAGSSFGPEDGLALGKLESFDLRLLFAK